MKVKVKRLTETAKMPYKKHDDDFCYDVYADSVEEIAPNVYKYHTNLSFQIERDEFYPKGSHILLSIDGRPRSSVWKTGMVLANCTGTVDEGYTGEVSFVFYHVMPNMPKYEVGDRIGQIKLGFTEKIRFVEVDELNETDRGSGGYGSTGTK